MSTVLHPKGSEPPSVYWRRRAFVIAIVVVVLLVLVAAWFAWPKSSGTATPARQSTAAVSTAATPAASTSSGSSESASPSPTGPVACDPGSISLNLAGYQKVKQGSKQVFRVSIKNTAAPCVLQVAASNFDLTVKSGTDRIWSTADCTKWVPAAKDVKLTQGQAHQLDLTWGLVRSKASCGTTKDVLKPGTYVATATFSKRVNAIQVFTISAAG